VGDRGQQRRSELVGLGQHRRLGRRPGQPPAVYGDGELVGERGEDPPVVTGQPPAGQGQRCLVIQLDGVVGVFGPDRRRATRDGFDPPTLAVAPQNGHGVLLERCTQLLNQLRERVVTVQQSAA
jgi:hypothetical protein